MANNIRPQHAPRAANLTLSKERLRDLNIFYDTSWTLYRCIWTPPPALHREELARRLAKQLRKSTTGDVDDDEILREKSGSLVGCEVEAVRVGESDGVSVSVRYERVECRFVVYGREQDEEGRGRSLLMVKAPAVVAKKVLSFLAVALELRLPEPLRLGHGLLTAQLEAFVGLCSAAGLEGEHSTQLLAEVVRDVKITISFDAPVSMELRSMDVDVPSQTVRQLLATARDEDTDFLAALADHLRRHTGLMIPRDATGTQCCAFLLWCDY